MLIDELKKSSFLKRSDVNPAILVTIDRAEFVNVAKEGAPEELKRCLYFKELEKPMVMNSTNMEIIAKIAGDRDDDHWDGHKIVLYDDPNISFGGKLVGGIRARAPKVVQKAPGSPLAPIAAAAKQHVAHARRDDPKPMSQVLAETADAAGDTGEEQDGPF